MKLSYRGVNNDEHVPLSLEVTEGEIMGEYRGLNLRCRTLKEFPMVEPAYELQYRAVAYNTNHILEKQTVAVEQALDLVAITPEATESTSTGLMPASRMSRGDILELDRIHSTYSLENLEHRLQIAKRPDDSPSTVREVAKEQCQFTT